MKKALSILLLSAVPLAAQDVSSMTTDPIGFTKVTCLANSDTIVGVPLRAMGSSSTKLVAAPAVSGDDATLTLAHNALPSLGTHYLKFNGGTRDGRWYDITANTANTVTLNLNGDNLDGVIGDESVMIAEYWTLNTLFPPDKATTDPTTTGHAIVASTNTLATGRKTEVRLRNLLYDGINPPYSGRYFIHNGIWKLSGGGNTDRGSLILSPDSFITISHPETVTQATTYRALGEVELHSLSIPLTTITSGARDNIVSIPRPINVSLDSLNLRQSGAFVSSTNTLATGRRDQLFLYNNETALINKVPSATYYVHDDIWKRSGGGNTDRGTDQIPAGAGFVIRKYQTEDGTTVFWENTPSY